MVLHTGIGAGMGIRSTSAAKRAGAATALAALATLAGCAAAPPDATDAGIAARAQELARTVPIIDTHIDAPYRAHLNPADVGNPAPGREFDHPRARAGGLNVAFMSIYTPPEAAQTGESRAIADALIDWVEAQAATHPERFAVVTCAADAARAQAADRVGLALGMENGSPLAGDPALVEHFARRGIRYVGFAHSKANAYADSSYDENEPWQGLSPAGHALVDELNRRGVMIDISHLSDRAAWQVIERSAAPVIASHSSLRHFIPGFHRNLADDMVSALGANGGVVQINFGSGFVSRAAQEWRRNRAAADGDAPYPFASIDDVLDHIDRTVQLAGIDHVGIGSDFDGVGDTLPIGLKHVGHYPNLVAGLLARGYGEDAIAKILGGNLLRVWREVEEYGRRHGHPPRCRLGNA